MFTIEQVNTAHTNVKSGADFPKYIQEIIQLGVQGYETYVTDGHTIFYGTEELSVHSGAKYPALPVSEKSIPDAFKIDLKAHQNGETGFPAFCLLSAQAGVEKWVVDTGKMTCTYFDRAGDNLLVEIIPAPPVVNA
jgi:uncharacterized protein YbcV (DUF1398 family)